jgi:hypothetical protein
LVVGGWWLSPQIDNNKRGQPCLARRVDLFL